MGAGRPRKEISWEEFDKLCRMQCTLREIANWFEVSEDTIERRIREKYDLKFAERWAQKADSGKIAIRRKQFEIAMSGCKTMLIWLGKQYLGQAEKQETSIGDKDKEGLTINFIKKDD